MSSANKAVPLGPDLRAALVAMVRKRVPESEVEDIVQSALAEAIESPHAPADSESLRRWIFGVAKNKVVDYHRRAGRESFELPDVAGAPAPHAEADLLRWAERNLPDGAENQKTLDWMIREGEGEKLESIAESEKLPPPRVRQRVSRLRRHFKENWQREVALLAALGVIVSAIVVFVLRKEEPPPITHEVVDPRAEPVRRLALERCAASDWKKCVDGLDEAKRLDPAGDARPEVKQARQAADNAAKAPPAPSSLAPLPTTAPPEAAPEPSFVPPSKLAPPMPSGSAMPFAPPRTKPESTEAPTPAPPPPVQTAPSKSDGPTKPQGKLPSKASSLGSFESDPGFASNDSLGSAGGGTGGPPPAQAAPFNGAKGGGKVGKPKSAAPAPESKK
jgi:DNA-directed RNA polymerase specialized sigma24 family protein